MDRCAYDILMHYLEKQESSLTGLKVAFSISMIIIWRQHRKIASLAKRVKEIEEKED